MPDPSTPRDLTGWKELATYLGVSVRTVQGWERTRGLPVHRLPGPRGPVYGFKAELDAWRQLPEAPAAAPLRSRRAIWAWTAALLLAAVIVFAMIGRARRPAKFRLDQNSIVIADSKGRELWRKHFEDLNAWEYENRPRIWFGDLDGSGKTSVLIQVIGLHSSDQDALIAYNQDGSERWRFTPGRDVRTVTESYVKPYALRNFLVAPLGRANELRIAVSSTHRLFFPCQIALLDRDGKLLREYWHSGHLTYLFAADGNHQGWNTLIAGGISNARRTATIVSLDPDHFVGASREESGQYQIQGFPEPVETSRILFPRSCVNRTLEPFVNVSIDLRNGEFHVQAHHRLSPDDATVFYTFGPDLKLKDGGIGSSFERAHLALQANGTLRHPLTNAEQDELQRFVYLK